MLSAAVVNAAFRAKETHFNQVFQWKTLVIKMMNVGGRAVGPVLTA